VKWGRIGTVPPLAGAIEADREVLCLALEVAKRLGRACFSTALGSAGEKSGRGVAFGRPTVRGRSSPKSEVRSPKSEVRSPKSEVRKKAEFRIPKEKKPRRGGLFVADDYKTLGSNPGGVACATAAAREDRSD
jgi:hypothetical protein